MLPALKYGLGLLRHMTWLQDRKRIEQITNLYAEDKLNFPTARRELLFSGFYPIPMAEAVLHLNHASQTIEDFLEKYRQTTQ